MKVIAPDSLWRRSTAPLLTYARLFVGLVKFEHTIFALPFAYSGALLAEQRMPAFWRMFWITVVMVAARSLAMALNRLLDARIDALNPRTAGREIPSGRLRRGEVWLFCAVSLGVLILATFQLPPVTRYLWPLVVAPFVIYPFTKRWTWLCHMVLGCTIGLGPVGAWVAVTGLVDWRPFFLGGAVAFWIAGFDIIYAALDVDFDRREGIHSIPADLGPRVAVWLTRCFHLVAAALLVVTGVIAARGPLYYTGVGLCVALLAMENYITRNQDVSRVNLAFMTLNSVLSIVYFLFTLLSILVET
ncbi:MAG: UbiA family prenyltransferase [Gaiellales bacterium]|nr:UbiA family prenyltransferase [Gaiellales bacterium]